MNIEELQQLWDQSGCQFELAVVGRPLRSVVEQDSDGLIDLHHYDGDDWIDYDPLGVNLEDAEIGLRHLIKKMTE